MLGGSFCAPDDTRRSTGGVESSVGTMALVSGSELAMGLRPLLWKTVPSLRMLKSQKRKIRTVVG